MSRHISRRLFLQSTTVAVATAGLGSRLGATSPNSKLRTAHIGVGGMGGADLGAVASHPRVEVAALCDVDVNHLAGPQSRFPSAATYRDYRELLADMSDRIDAVVVSTPDHTHAPAAMTALRLGKPVYCQKPLTHSVYESRQLRLVSQANKLTTQMGIQVHSSGVYRQSRAVIQSGALGKVHTVYAWSNKNWGYDGPAFEQTEAPPESLDWNLWLGTAAERPFVPGKYHPANWRMLVDFGTGTLGDMGVHIFDTPFAALELTAPLWVKTTCRPPTGIGHPTSNVIEYEFPGTRYTTETVRWKWLDGGAANLTAEQLGLPEGTGIPGQGSLCIGEEGSLLLPHVAQAQLFPIEKFADYSWPESAEGNHYHEWVDACCGIGTTSADFAYGGQLTESLLLGVVANRFPDTKLVWDAEKLAFPDSAEATALLRRNYRSGFEVEGL